MKRLSQMKLNKNFMALCLMCFSSYLAISQTVVSGVITDGNDGTGVPGATILEKGTSNGTITDIDGNYSLNVTDAATAVLEISFIGYEKVEAEVNNRSVINISLELDLQELSEVVVVGYGSIRKSDNTGSLSSVSSKELTEFPALSAVQTLQGRAAGVQISSTNGGEPGANFNIRVRGGSSINANSDPIRVVDGFVGGEMPPPQDIASIEILKDASATAIYGSRAANGVILITTKKGTEGKLKVNVSSSYSVQETTNRLDLLEGEDFEDYMQEFDVSYQYNDSINTDWQDEIFRTGYVWDNQVSVSGGNDAVKYYVSATHFEQEGIVINSDYERQSITSNLSFKASERVKVGVNLYGRRSVSQGVLTQESTGGSSNTGVVGAAARLEPDTPVRDADGNFTQSRLGDNIDNPVAIANGIDRERVSDRIQSNSFIDIEIFDWLSFRSTLGTGVTNNREGVFTSSQLLRGGNGGIAQLEFSKSTNLLTENYFTISKEFDKHRINWVNGYSFQRQTSENLFASSSDFVSESVGFWALSGGAGDPAVDNGNSERILKSYYSRMVYSFMDKYVLTGTIRYDGASNFAENKKWAYFPSGAFAWNIGDEPFLSDIAAIYELKLRASYGLTGNQAIGAYESLPVLRSQFSYREGEAAFVPENIGNPNLTWETTAQFNIGIDAGLFDDRINFSLDYYDKRTDDLLFNKPIPAWIGTFDDYRVENIGSVSNKGLELALTTRNVSKPDFTWSTDFVYSRNRNEIMSLPDTTIIPYEDFPGHFNISVATQLLQVGQPIGVYYGYIYDGVILPTDAANILDGYGAEIGDENFVDLNGDGSLDSDDRTIIGDPNPDFTWSVNNNFSYKDFDFSFFFQGVHGNDMFNLTRMELESFRGTSNASTAALDRWSRDNQDGSLPSADDERPLRVSSRFVEDGSYVRLRNVVIGYSLPSDVLNKVHISSLRFYASAQNLLTFTNYTGLDPETAYNSDNNANENLNLGLDYGGYPNVRTFTFGLNLGF